MDHPEIELDASQALFAARMLELAVHHPGPWTFRWGEVEVEATKEITDVGVVFTGAFPDLCYLHPPEGGLEILCEGRVVGIRPAEHGHPGDTGFTVTWEVLTRHGVSR